eukprot:g33695.t1
MRTHTDTNSRWSQHMETRTASTRNTPPHTNNMSKSTSARPGLPAQLQDTILTSLHTRIGPDASKAEMGQAQGFIHLNRNHEAQAVCPTIWHDPDFLAHRGRSGHKPQGIVLGPGIRHS